MTSPAITFDRLTYIDRLKQAGVDESHARAHADALDSALRDSVATKADLEKVEQRLDAKIDALEQRLEAKIDSVEQRLEAKIDAVEQRLEAKIESAAANLKVEILRWLLVTQIGLAGFLFAAFKFLK